MKQKRLFILLLAGVLAAVLPMGILRADSPASQPSAPDAPATPTLGKLLADLNSENPRAARLAAARGLEKMNDLPPSAARALAAALADELEQRLAQMGVAVSPDEISVDRLAADPGSYISHQFIVRGTLAISQYYAHGYEETGEIYYSLQLRAAPGDSDASATPIYVSRSVGKALVDRLISDKEIGSAPAVVRLVATINARRYRGPETQLMLEGLDWQFLQDDGKTWGAWSQGVGGKTTPR